MAKATGFAADYVINPGLRLLIADLGISSVRVLRRAGLPADLFSRGNIKLRPEAFFDFMTAIEAEAGHPNLPIEIAKALSVEVFDPPMFAAICSRDLNVAVRRIAKYKPLIGPMRLSVEQTPSETILGFVWPTHLKPPAISTMLELVYWVALTRLCTRTEVRPIRATSPQLPQDPGAYREYLGIDVECGLLRRITFSAEDAARPFLTANEPMWEFFEPELRRRLSVLEAGAPMAERVRGTLLELLPAGNASIGDVAFEMALSERTLQRRLKAEGTTFQAELNRTRESLARYYLSRASITVPEIAFLLGYEEKSSFYRAFREWTGQTPEQMRLAAV